MDQEPLAPDQLADFVPNPQGFDPKHYFASPSIRYNMATIKPHTCMKNVVHRGNYIHCKDGNHGIRLEPDQMLVGLDKDGNRVTRKNMHERVAWDIVKIVPEEAS